MPLSQAPDSLHSLSPKLSRRHWMALAATAASASLLPAGARAQGSAQAAIKIVVPFAAGAGTDAVGRLMAQKLGEILGRHVVVENRTGASGAIGAQYVAQSAPDGNTLLLVAAPFTTVPAALPQAGYDPLAQFTPVGMIASGPLLWAVNKELPVSNLKELIALAKRQPGKLNYGSAGAGGINHLHGQGRRGRRLHQRRPAANRGEPWARRCEELPRRTRRGNYPCHRSTAGRQPRSPAPCQPELAVLPVADCPVE